MGCSSSKDDVSKIVDKPTFNTRIEAIEISTPPLSPVPVTSVATNPEALIHDDVESNSCEKTDVRNGIIKSGLQKEEMQSTEAKQTMISAISPQSVEEKVESGNSEIVYSEAQMNCAASPSSGSLSEQQRKSPMRHKNDYGFIDFQSFLGLESVVELMNHFPNLVEDQVLEVFEVMDEDEDGFVTTKQAEDIVFIIRGREQPHSVDTMETVAPVSEAPCNDKVTSAASSYKLLQPLVPNTEPASPSKKSLTRGTSSMAIEKGIILNDFLAEITSPASPPPPVKRGFLITSSGDSPLSSPLRPTSTSSSQSSSRPPSMGGKSRFHVLDQGILFHLDSNVTSGPVALDKYGVSLQGHTKVYSEPDTNLILLSTKALISEEEDETILLSIKSEQNRVDWVQAINEHIAYIAEQERLVRKQLVY